MRAALIKAFGEPTEVLELADVYERPIRDSGRISSSTFAAQHRSASPSRRYSALEEIQQR